MWAKVGQYLLKAAIFAYGHKDEVIAAINAIEAAKAAKAK